MKVHLVVPARVVPATRGVTFRSTGAQMSDQTDLFAPPRPPPTNGTPTSTEAARRITTCVRAQHRRLLDLLAAHPDGLTDEQMQDLLGMNPNTQRPRRGELVTMKLVVKAGRRRETKSGTPAEVWTLAPEKAEASHG